MCPASVLGEYEDIITFEAKRAGRIRGYDEDDLKQEARAVVAFNCLPRLDETNTGRTYIRRSVRNALRNLRRAATTAARCPRNARGRTLPFDAPLDYDSLIDVAPSPEQIVATKELMQALGAMNVYDRALLYSAFVDGARAKTSEEVEDARKRAEAILTEVLDGVQPAMRGEQQTMTKKAKGRDIPSCHAEGEDPVGYETDLEDAQDCQDCLDKMTCLPAGIKSKLIDADLSIDPEVKACEKGLITMEDLRKRIRTRLDLRESGKDVPESMTYDHPPVSLDKLNSIDNDPTVPPDKRGDNNMSDEAKAKKSKKSKAKKPKAADDTNDESTPAEGKSKKTKAKKEPKAKKTKNADGKAEGKAKPAKKKSKAKDTSKKPKKEKASKKPKDKKAKKEKKAKKSKGDAPNNRMGEKGQFKYSGKPKKLPDGRVELPNGRFVPAPKELTKDKMQLSIAKLNEVLALDFDLTIGMKLIQERRNGENVVITLKKNGYHLNLTDDTYASLSGACMAAFLRSVSGPAVFNFEKHNNILVKGKGVPGGEYRREVEEEEEEDEDE